MRRRSPHREKMTSVSSPDPAAPPTQQRLLPVGAGAGSRDDDGEDPTADAHDRDGIPAVRGWYWWSSRQQQAASSGGDRGAASAAAPGCCGGLAARLPKLPRLLLGFLYNLAVTILFLGAIAGTGIGLQARRSLKQMYIY